MLRVMLAGLVIQKVLTLEEAEAIEDELGGETIPGSVRETIALIERVRADFKARK